VRQGWEVDLLAKGRAYLLPFHAPRLGFVLVLTLPVSAVCVGDVWMSGGVVDEGKWGRKSKTEAHKQTLEAKPTLRFAPARKTQSIQYHANTQHTTTHTFHLWRQAGTKGGLDAAMNQG
jgi:hypothetical protein